MQTLSRGFSALLSGWQLCSASKDTRSHLFSQIHLFLFNLSPVALSWDQWICAGAFALWRLWPRWNQRLLDEPLQWKGVAITYNNLIKSNLYSFISSGSPSGLVCHKRETLDSPQKHPGGLTICCLHGWIVELSGKVSWLEGVSREKTDWSSHSANSIL